MRREVKVGAFALLGLSLVAALLMMTNPFAPARVEFVLCGEDVEGVSEGDLVRMHGRDVGQIAAIQPSTSVADCRLMVNVELDRNAALHVTSETRATVEARGLLGGKLIVLTTDAAGDGPLPEGSEIPLVKSPNPFEGWLGAAAPSGDERESIDALFQRISVTLDLALRAAEQKHDEVMLQRLRRARENLVKSRDHLSEAVRVLDRVVAAHATSGARGQDAGAR